MSTVVAQPQVHTTVRYFHNLPGTTVEPVVIGGPEKPKQPPSIDVPVSITDVTGQEADYLLSRNGFQYVKHTSQIKDAAGFEDEELVKKVYYPEMATFLRGVLEQRPGPKPSNIEILYHVIRTGGGPGEDPEKNTIRGPVFGVHIDQTAAETPANARRWLGREKADALLGAKARVQLVNMWRPLRPVRRDALAVADAGSVGADEIVELPVVLPDHTFTQCQVSYRGAARHQWHFKRGMGPGDVLVFVQDDTTKKAGAPRQVAHVAFRDPGADEDREEARSSIELRAFVFYDDDYDDLEE